jgi:hypothetical protein
MVGDCSCPAGRCLRQQWRRFFDSETDARGGRYEGDSHLGRLGISPLPLPPSWNAVPLRLIVGLGFIEHGFAKLARGADFERRATDISRAFRGP